MAVLGARQGSWGVIALWIGVGLLAGFLLTATRTVTLLRHATATVEQAHAQLDTCTTVAQQQQNLLRTRTAQVAKLLGVLHALGLLKEPGAFTEEIQP